jgi:pilus assembly protein Flp/PilA
VYTVESPTKGQGLIEYALILVLVAIVVFVSLLFMGPFMGNIFSDINTSMSTL